VSPAPWEVSPRLPKRVPVLRGALPEPAEVWLQALAMACGDPCPGLVPVLLCCCKAEEEESQGW